MSETIPHCRACGAELMECDECHGDGRVEHQGSMDPETGAYDTSDCGECSGRGGYCAITRERLDQAEGYMQHMLNCTPVSPGVCECGLSQYVAKYKGVVV